MSSYPQTKYHRMSNVELLGLVEERDRSSSALLQELANRLNKVVEGVVVGPKMNYKAECPVCEAQLIVNVDDQNQLFELETIKND